MSSVSEQMASYLSEVLHSHSHAGRSDRAFLGTHNFLKEKVGLVQALVGFLLQSWRQKQSTFRRHTKGRS